MPERSAILGVEFGREGGRLSGEVPLAGFERLSRELRSCEGGAKYALEGHVRRDGKAAIRLAVSATLVVTCQRCLQALDLAIEARRELVFVDADMLSDLDDEEEDSDYLPAEERFEPMDVVEDELLLALPMAPMHEDAECARRPDDPVPEPPVH